MEGGRSARLKRRRFSPHGICVTLPPDAQKHDLPRESKPLD
jgi:hypothetical protein